MLIISVPSKSKSRPSSSFHPLPGSVEPGGNGLSDKSNSNTQISQQFTVSQSKPNLNEILKNKATSTPIFHNQYFSNSPIKPPKKNFTLQNSSGLPEWSSLGSAMMNQKGNLNAKNTSKVSSCFNSRFWQRNNAWNDWKLNHKRQPKKKQVYTILTNHYSNNLVQQRTKQIKPK